MRGAEGVRLGGGDISPRQSELHRDTFAHEPWQTLRAAVAGNSSQLILGLAELGGVAGQPHGASHRNLAPPAERESVDAGDHWLAQIFDQVEYALAAMRVLLARDCVVLGELANVGAGYER